jgi:hypothetical protein
MRCPACTTTVEDFKTLHLTPDPKVVEAAAPPASKATKSAARQAALSIEDDGKPVLLRFDNASWVRAASSSPRAENRPLLHPQFAGPWRSACCCQGA